MRLILTYLLVKKIEYDISTSEMLQKETKKSYITFPNDIAFAKLRTCACFSVTSVPKFANTAVWANSIVALRVHVTGGRRRAALIYVWNRHQKHFSQA